ncbi:MAG: Quinate/shikimate 5-dehydrogenase delta [Devosia sp.]|nr:Quinate/shikimate 5-dehydrogenase delta [Devosia sp.]
MSLDVGQCVRAALASRLASNAMLHSDIIVGLVGRGIGASRSPAMHEREGGRVGLAYTYVLLDFDQMQLDDFELPRVIAEAEALGFSGLNVTHPFKQAIVGHVDVLSPEASAINAINTVLLEQGRRVGHNTDSWGFAESFRSGLQGVRVSEVVQFGAGGAGAATAHALLAHPVDRLVLCDSDMARAEQLAHRLATRFGKSVDAVHPTDVTLGTADGVVNATPVGMDKYPGLPFEREKLQSRHWVADIVYFPAETELLRIARSLGCRTLPGTGMAIFQAVRAFQLFTGIAPDPAQMVHHFRAAA